MLAEIDDDSRRGYDSHSDRGGAGARDEGNDRQENDGTREADAMIEAGTPGQRDSKESVNVVGTGRPAHFTPIHL